MAEVRPKVAALSMIAAMAVIGLIDNLFVALSGKIGLWQFHAARSALAIALLVVVSLFLGRRLRPRSVGAVAIRSGLIAASMVIYFGSLGFLPIAQVAAGLFTAPIFVLVISWAFLGRGIGPRRVLAVAVGFTGIIVTLRPAGGDLGLLSLAPVLAGLLYGLGNLATRELCADESVLILVCGGLVGLGLIGAAVSLTLTLLLPGLAVEDAFLLRPWTWPDAVTWAWICVQVVGVLVGVGLLTRAYAMAEASSVAVFEYTFLVFAAVWAFVLRGEIPTLVSLAGMALIAGGGAILTMRPQTGPPAASPGPHLPGGRA